MKQHDPAPTWRRLAIANQKGGVGKTTTAIHLAHGFAVAGLRTLLLDLDPQGNASTGLGVAKEAGRGSSGLVRGRVEAVALTTVVENLDICPADPDLMGAEDHVSTPDGNRAFAAALEGLARDHDRVVVDCPPALGRLTRAALRWVDRVIVPIQCEFFALEGLAQVLSVIESIRLKENRTLQLGGVLLTMFDPALPFHTEVVEDVRKRLGARVFETVVPRDVTLAEAASHGVPVVDYDCLSCAAHAYIRLTREILEHGREASG